MLFKKLPRQADNFRKYKIKQIPKMDILYSRYSREKNEYREYKMSIFEFVLFCMLVKVYAQIYPFTITCLLCFRQILQ